MKFIYSCGIIMIVVWKFYLSQKQIQKIWIFTSSKSLTKHLQLNLDRGLGLIAESYSHSQNVWNKTKVIKAYFMFHTRET